MYFKNYRRYDCVSKFNFNIGCIFFLFEIFAVSYLMESSCRPVTKEGGSLLKVGKKYPDFEKNALIVAIYRLNF